MKELIPTHASASRGCSSIGSSSTGPVSLASAQAVPQPPVLTASRQRSICDTSPCIPGFGPALCSRLENWRRQCERRFVFDPSRAVTPADIKEVRDRYVSERASHRSTLSTGAESLRRLSARAAVSRPALLAQLEEATTQLAHAEADLKITRFVWPKV